MIYIVVEGIVFGLFEATNEVAIDPFDGQQYKVKKYEGKDTVSNFSDWCLFDCENAAIALLMAAVGVKHSRLRKKIKAQMDLRDWALSNGQSIGLVPALDPKNWLAKKIKDKNFDPWEITPLEWLEMYPDQHAIKDTSGHKDLLALYSEPFGYEWVESHA